MLSWELGVSYPDSWCWEGMFASLCRPPPAVLETSDIRHLRAAATICAGLESSWNQWDPALQRTRHHISVLVCHGRVSIDEAQNSACVHAHRDRGRSVFSLRRLREMSAAIPSRLRPTRRRWAGFKMRCLPAPGSGAPKDGFCRQQKSPSSQDFGGR